MALEFKDLESLPDDVKIELGDGKTITLGEVRNAALDHVNQRISELTPREQKLVTREQALAAAEEKVRQTMAQLPDLVANATHAATPPANNASTSAPPLGYTTEQWNAILQDPYARPLVTAMATLAEKAATLEKRLEEAALTDKQRQDAQHQLEETRWINHQLDQLASQDERYKTPEERKALLDYAQEVIQRRDITVLHKARNYDTAVKSAEERGYQRGLTEGKGTAPVPSVVHGTRVVPTPAAPEKLPKTFAEFADSAANDPAFIQEIREAASTPPPGQQ